MPPRAIQLERLVTQLHRRRLWMGLVESAGAGVMFGCIAALPMLIINAWRGGPAVQWLIGMSTVGLIAGLLWQVRRWPSRMQTLQQADRQWGLSDLLSTAWRIRFSDNPWERSVVALAERRAGTMRAADLIVRRWGASAWGGIGLTVALSISLAMLGMAANGSTESPRPAEQPERFAAEGRSRFDETAAANSSRSAPSPDSESTNLTDAWSQEPGQGGERKELPTAQASAGGPESQPDDERVRAGPVKRTLNNTLKTVKKGSDPFNGGGQDGATGPGERADQGVGGENGSEKAREAETLSHELDSLPREADLSIGAWQAQPLMPSGRVPPAYRELVRDYFDR